MPPPTGKGGPTYYSNKLNIINVIFQLAALRRLRRPIVKGAPNSVGIAGLKCNGCSKQIDVYGDHASSCTAMKGQVAARHHNVVRVLTQETQHAAERSFLKGFKMPVIASGALLVVLADHWEHGKNLLGWLTGSKP